MSEPKRVYVPVFDSGEPAFYRNSSDQLVVLVYRDNIGPGLALYEPAVPKCKTCKHFFSYADIVGSTYGSCASWRVLYKCPPDGSGYCHLHSEL